ncbi:hypothetical protein HK096_007871, partial [Nowakowskiella sp. JEL0078]
MAAPKQRNTVILLRHAEKHEWNAGLAPSKLQIASYEDNKLLSVKGRERAHALVAYFDTRNEIIELLDVHPLSAIVCQDVDTEGMEAWGKSERPRETMKPFAKHKNIDLTLYTKKQAAELTTRILTSDEWVGKTVIVCWAHQEIPELTKRLGVPESVIPVKW